MTRRAARIERGYRIEAALRAEASSFETRAEALGHRLIRDKDGKIDIFRLEYDNHNGPECERCGESWCHHCLDEPEPCPSRQKRRKKR